MVLVLTYKVCICTGTLLVGSYIIVVHVSRAAFTFSPATWAMLLRGNAGEVCGTNLKICRFTVS